MLGLLLAIALAGSTTAISEHMQHERCKPALPPSAGARTSLMH